MFELFPLAPIFSLLSHVYVTVVFSMPEYSNFPVDPEDDFFP